MHARVVLLLLALALAGCSGQDPAATPATASPDGALPGADPLQAILDDPQHAVQAPAWLPGQWWEWRTTFGTQVMDGTFCSIVAPDGTLVTEKIDHAKQEAAFGHPLLGAIAPGLGMSGYGGDWDLFDFPLTDGKSWTATLPNIAWDVLLPSETATVAMTASWDGSLPGYRIMGHVEQGMLLEATYLPATGWFGELMLYDIDPGQEALEVGFTAVSAGTNYTGPVFAATAQLLLQLEDGNGFTDFPTEGGEPFLIPEPQGQFTMTAGTVLYGAAQGASVIGGRVITLTDPTGQQRQAIATGTPEGEAGLFLDEPSIAGQWTLATAGAGGMSYAYVELYEVTVTESAL